MKKWPSKNKVVDVEDLVSPIMRAIKKHYNLVPKHKEIQDIPWSGYDIGKGAKATMSNAKNQLTAKNLKHQIEQGRDPLNTIINLCVVTAIEQGRRIHKEELRIRKGILLLQLEDAKRTLETIFNH